MKTLLAALLLAPGFALAGYCYPHPDTGVVHCYSASDCPAGTAWNASTQACAPAQAPTAAACTGTASGVYTPAAIAAQNVAFLDARPAMWSRINGVVTVAGAVHAHPTVPGLVHFYLAPPVPTVFDTHFELAGVMSVPDGQSSDVVSVPREDKARFVYTAAGASAAIRYVYSYSLKGCR